MVIFRDKSLEELIKLNKHCIHEDYIDYLSGKTTKPMPKANGNKKYKIGIIVPNYNNAEWLEKSLGSIKNQTYTNYEIIFIDDCSEDNSVEIAKKYADKVIELKQKRYNGGARNEGYLHLSKDVDYVFYLDSDDWLKDIYSLETINQNLQGEPDVLFVGIAADYKNIIRSYYAPKYNDRYEAILGWSGSSGKVIKKELAIKCLYQEGTLKEDRTHHYKVCIEMNSFRCLETMISIYNRNNTHSVTTIRDIKWKADTIRNWADSIETYYKYKGRDSKLDEILQARVENCKQEVMNNEDSQQ